jgi:hypothetical protein
MTWIFHKPEKLSVLKIRVLLLRRIFGPKTDERKITKEFHNEERHGLNYSPNIIRVTKLRRMRWTGQVARMTKMRNLY